MLLPVSSVAVGNIHYGGTEVHPELSLSYMHDDNVYLNDDDLFPKVSDNLYVISPSLEIKRSHDERVYSLKYNADVYRYSKETQEDKENHTGTAFIDTRFPGGMNLMLRDTYVKTADPASSETTDMDERTQNLFQAAIGSNVFDRLSFSLKYSNTIHDYEEDPDKPYLETYDRKEETYGGELTLNLLPKTSFFLDYSKGIIEYENVVVNDVRDSDSTSASVGLKGQLTSKSMLNLSVGYLNRDYEDENKEDFNSVIMALTFDYQYSSYTKISLTGKRNITESFFSTGTDNYNYYTENILSLSLPFRLSNKISSYINIYYGVNDYHEAASGIKRKDYLYGGGFKLDYRLKSWLKAGLGYIYRERDSDIDTEDYENNQYTANLTAEF